MDLHFVNPIPTQCIVFFWVVMEAIIIERLTESFELGYINIMVVFCNIFSTFEIFILTSRLC